MISGVREELINGGVVYYIDNFSDEIKQLIRTQLTNICFGSVKEEETPKAANYQSALNEFLKRLESNDDNKKKGQVGELLFHILMRLNNDYVPASSFFNTEERSAKKGFDKVFYNNKDRDIWIAEVKSGSLSKVQDTPNKAVVTLINRSKVDLKNRLNNENYYLWINAINHAMLAISKNADEKDAIVSLLEEYTIDPSKGVYKSIDKSVVLVGTLFHTINECIEPIKIDEKRTRMIKEGIFKDIMVVAIQKSTYEAVIEFMEEEAKDE